MKGGTKKPKATRGKAPKRGHSEAAPEKSEEKISVSVSDKVDQPQTPNQESYHFQESSSLPQLGQVTQAEVAMLLEQLSSHQPSTSQASQSLELPVPVTSSVSLPEFMRLSELNTSIPLSISTTYSTSQPIPIAPRAANPEIDYLYDPYIFNAHQGTPTSNEPAKKRARGRPSKRKPSEQKTVNIATKDTEALDRLEFGNLQQRSKDFSGINDSPKDKVDITGGFLPSKLRNNIKFFELLPLPPDSEEWLTTVSELLEESLLSVSDESPQIKEIYKFMIHKLKSLKSGESLDESEPDLGEEAKSLLRMLTLRLNATLEYKNHHLTHMGRKLHAAHVSHLKRQFENSQPNVDDNLQETPSLPPAAPYTPASYRTAFNLLKIPTGLLSTVRLKEDL